MSTHAPRTIDARCSRESAAMRQRRSPRSSDQPRQRNRAKAPPEQEDSLADPLADPKADGNAEPDPALTTQRFSA
eukprot:5273436-Pyramimonas_sp.AAC.1